MTRFERAVYKELVKGILARHMVATKADVEQIAKQLTAHNVRGWDNQKLVAFYFSRLDATK